MAEITLEPEVIEIPEPDISHLITEDDTPVDNIFSEKQMRLLTESLYTSWAKADFVAMANVGLFYSIRSQAIIPDVLVSTGVKLPEELWQKKHRSYFIWEYGKPPDLVIEVVSNRKGEELGRKKTLYAGIGVAYYVVYDPERQLSDTDIHLFERQGATYIHMESAWFPQLGLGLQRWEGAYEGSEAIWLRWHDPDGEMLATGAEAKGLAQQLAEEERQRAEEERLRAEEEHRRAEKLAAQLHSLGVEPEE